MRTRFVVIGAGIMGLAAGWRLAEEGHRPVVVDQFPAGHTRGASHGATRNFNDAYSEAHYLRLLRRSRQLWDRLSAVAGAQLLALHGLATHGDEAEIERIRIAMREHDLHPRLLTAAQAAERWPGMRFATDVLVSEDAGVVRAAAALAALEGRIEALGGQVLRGAPVSHLEPASDHVDVRVAGPAGPVTIRADVAVVAAGAWTSRLLAGLVDLPPLTVTEESPAHFAPVIGAPWPSFNHLLGDDWPAPVYGMPTPGEGIKVGFHRVGAEVDPDARTHAPAPGQETLLPRYVREWMPGLDPDRLDWVSCTYTNTPDAAFVLDRRGPLVVGAGFSGHGFKFGTGVGDVLASLALDPDATAADAFRLAR
ncbi:FAD-dependent oxidoreductase [Microbacterium album]|uniref:N-methyltryptophan oxidase n=1 Tax=Microbacterium album TaxID=2053191 RepID=A0A917ICK3_9MICO|nr:FAD-dependent oxidoreductase [Microbacterium album]GGH34609.1 N-methyltryptophan oxidase [Microbacterium album]